MSESHFTCSPVTPIINSSLFSSKSIIENVQNNFLINKFNESKSIHQKNFWVIADYSNRDKRTETYDRIENFLNIFSEEKPQIFRLEGSQYLAAFFENLTVSFHGYSNLKCSAVSVMGSKEEIERFIPILYEYFEKYQDETKSFVNWCIIDDAGKMVKIKKELEVKNTPFTEMYPFLNGESLEEYYERFNSSSASILLLQGPPGTGKTTFIRGLLHHLKKNALLSYDEAILKSDNFLSSFIEDSSVNYLIFEDADAYLTSRESGNRTIHKFLNAGDGLISSSDKKIIFTTNLASLSDVDQALIRPGRCFDVLQFRQLTKDEAIAVAEKQGVEVELPEKNFTIAEIFNSQKNTKKKEARAIGFAM
jgi:hypothetical protein